jgi:hypothetical protein
MPKNKVNDLITDQEMAFARHVLSGTMTDRDAAQAAGLNPDTAAYTKAKPRVRAYMLEFRAAMQQQLVDHEADLARQAAEEKQRKDLWRQRVLDRLWEIAALPAEVTRGSITGQVKAISMIVSMEGLIPDRRAASAKISAAAPVAANIYPAAAPACPSSGVAEPWQHATTGDPQPGPAASQEEEQPPAPEPSPAPAAGSSTAPVTPSHNTEPHVPKFPPPSDMRLPFSIQKNRFGGPR